MDVKAGFSYSEVEIYLAKLLPRAYLLSFKVREAIVCTFTATQRFTRYMGCRDVLDVECLVGGSLVRC